MGAGKLGDGKKYRAFISYSHADEAWGGWLQRNLERYRAPGALAKELEAKGAPQRLSPVFRDREDFPAGDDLNSAIQEAIAESDFQIVLCSPRAAKSRWVNEEVKLFYRLHGPGRTLAIIIDGEPGASNIAGREEEECLPEALRFKLDEDGEVISERAEPLAADARAAADGKRYAFLKIAAGMLGVGLDDLIRRDQRRRTRIIRIAAASALSIIATLSATTLFALNQRQLALAQQHEAERQQHQAERLIDFMLTGLRDKLEPLGKLDILDDVADKALAYYKAQNLSALDGDSLNRRARALMFAGAVLRRRGELNNALTAFKAAKTTTDEQLRRDPDNPDRIFDHAQSVFYVADVASIRGEFDTAEAGYQEYYKLARQLVSIDPRDPKWQLELAYATNNLGSARSRSGKFDEAAAFFEKSVEIRRALYEESPNNKNAAKAYAYALSWLAYNELSQGRFRIAINDLQNQVDIYFTILENDPDNFPILDKLVTAHRRLGEAQIALGDLDSATSNLDKARLISTKVLQREPDEKLWLGNSAVVEIDRSEVFAFLGDRTAAASAADRAIKLVQAFPSGTDSDRDYRSNTALAYARRVAVGDQSSARDQAAGDLSVLMEVMLKSPQEYRADAIGKSCIALARYNRNKVDVQQARQLIDRCRKTLVAQEGALSADSLASLFILFYESGEHKNALRIANTLDELGFKRPDYLKTKQGLQATLKQ